MSRYHDHSRHKRPKKIAPWLSEAELCHLKAISRATDSSDHATVRKAIAYYGASLGIPLEDNKKAA
jgi:hypothetical protein